VITIRHHDHSGLSRRREGKGSREPVVPSVVHDNFFPAAFGEIESLPSDTSTRAG
jgi:hypothetical protein